MKVCARMHCGREVKFEKQKYCSRQHAPYAYLQGEIKIAKDPKRKRKKKPSIGGKVVENPDPPLDQDFE